MKAGKPDAGAEPAAPKGPKAPVEPARLRVKYRAEVMPALMKQFGYTNVMQVPRLVKVVLNRGTGDASSEAKVMETYVDELRAITGQRPVVTRARRSIAAFKLREGMPIGCKVTLRGERMYEFFDRLVSLTLPRVRDFRGVSPKGFDGRGNFNLGLDEQIIFPEIEYEKIVRVKGVSISIGTTAKTDDEGRALLKALGFPFREQA
ncbi:MAG: 50S ribosomal protein L5 [Candidatus Methylomirabilia bacterium]